MGIRRINILVVLCFLALPLFAGCADRALRPQIVKSMAGLDRVYIPALTFTGQQHQRESEIALEQLRKKWAGFHQEYYNVKIRYGLNITDKFWKEDFDRVTRLIATAESLTRDGNMVDAHLQLREMRVLLRDLRYRNGITYYLDGMTRFHDAMDGIIAGLRGRDVLTQKDINRLRSHFKEAQRGWLKLSRQELDAELFGFGKEKVKAVKNRVKYQERMIASFAAALSSRSMDRIFQSAQDLRPNYTVLYKAFGDFQPVFDRVKWENKPAYLKAPGLAGSRRKDNGEDDNNGR
jgi:hypothetical protein